jgi:uracil-DNA glycosylase family 4
MSASHVNCVACPLWQARKHIVDGCGPLDAHLMVVGEAPGEREDSSGVPFVGQSGKLLRATIAEASAGLPLKVFYTNSVRCRPPDNRDPTEEELGSCQIWLEEEIQAVRPRVILAVGRVGAQQASRALDSLSRSTTAIPTSSSAERGVPPPTAALVSTYHPAYILRQPRKRQEWKEQVAAAVGQALSPIGITSTTTPPEPAPYSLETLTPRHLYPTAEWFAADTETDSLGEGFGDVRVGWSASDGQWCGFTQMDPSLWMQGASHVYLHNAKYDLDKLGLDPYDFERWDDTMLMAYVLRYPEVGLKKLGPRMTGVEMEGISAILGTGKKRIQFSAALLQHEQESVGYAAKDALVTSRLAQILVPQLEAEPKLKRYYTEIEKPLVPVLMNMERRGVLIDADALQEAGRVIDAEVGAQKAELAQALGVENPGSVQQTAKALGALGFSLPTSRETGALVADAAALLASVQVEKADDLDRDEPRQWLIGSILDYRGLVKLRGTYVTGIIKRLWDDGSLHGRFNQAGTSTNRLSSSDPNLQNMPAHDKSPLSAVIRRAFIPRPGYRLVVGDYSQAQLRIFADYTRDPVFVRSYPWDGPAKDVHLEATLELFPGQPEKRKGVKNGVFATLFGAETEKLAKTVGVPEADAAGFMSRLRERIPSLATWPLETAGLLARVGYLETRLGWREYYPLFWSPIQREARKALREAACFRIQGTEAGIVKVLMLESQALMSKYQSHLLLQVHDELVFEVPERHVDSFSSDLAALGHAVAKRYIKAVPLVLEVKDAANWRDAK